MQVFKNIIGVCTGTEIFIKISKNSLLRTFFDVFILSCMLSILIAASQSYTLLKNIDANEIKLSSTFGEIQIDSSGMYPTKNSDKVITFFHKELRLDYVPANKIVSKEIFNDSNVLGGLIWRPKSISMWINYEKEEVILVRNILSQKNNKMSYVHRNELQPIINSVENDEFSEFASALPSRVPFEFSALTIFACVALFFYWTLFALFIVFAYTFIFSSFSFMLSSPKKATMKEYFVLSIYAGIPGMIIASVFLALNLYYISYPTIYAVSLLIYLFPAMRRVELDTISNESNKPK